MRFLNNLHFKKMTLLKERVFKDFDSSAIESITFNQPIVKIVWKTSTKEYNYSVNDTNFEELVEKSVKNSESIGKLVNIAIKENKIQIIEDLTTINK